MSGVNFYNCLGPRPVSLSRPLSQRDSYRRSRRAGQAFFSTAPAATRRNVLTSPKKTSFLMPAELGNRPSYLGLLSSSLLGREEHFRMFPWSHGCTRGSRRALWQLSGKPAGTVDTPAENPDGCSVPACRSLPCSPPGFIRPVLGILPRYKQETADTEPQAKAPRTAGKEGQTSTSPKANAFIVSSP